MSITINKEYPFSKVGLNEVEGLTEVLTQALAPIETKLRESIYWHDKTTMIEPVEYKSRDGFIPHSHNCGGLAIDLVLPKCEEYEFGFLEFGECDECGTEALGLDRYGAPKQCGYNGDECASESNGHLDAHLRIWLKFEGIDADGLMEFYLVMSGGNGDAPYFREKYQPVLFETSFTAKSLAGVKRQASIAVKKLLNKLN